MAGRIYAGVLTACGLFAGVAIGAMAVLISLDVVLRNLGIVNFPWLLEVSEYVLFVATFLAAPWVLRLGAHVRVDLLFEIMPKRAARVLDIVAALLGCAACLLLARHGARIAWDAFTRGDMLFKELVIPEWPLLAIIPVSAVLLAAEFARRVVRIARGHDDDHSAPLIEGP
jgi:TRAP-type C4-dicarboxylate transport system permease small subunit